MFSSSADAAVVAKGAVFVGSAVVGIAGAVLHLAANGVRSVNPELESLGFKEVAGRGYYAPSRLASEWSKPVDDTTDAVL